MKRRISISILLSFLVLTTAVLLMNYYSNKALEENYISTEDMVTITENESITANQEYISYEFYVKNDNNRLSVYRVKTSELYMETSIKVQELPNDLQEKLKSGIYFKTEAELYDFLESYSS